MTKDLFQFGRPSSPFEGDGAMFSDDRAYRYVLWRMWDVQLPYVNFILLNPSTADEVNNDPTVERQVRRVASWKRRGLDTRLWGGVVITNAYAFRSTYPRVLRTVLDPIGPKGDDAIMAWAKGSDLCIVGWGGHVDEAVPGRQADILGMLRSAGVVPHALAFNADGTPGHPLYVDYDRMPVPVPLVLGAPSC